MSTTTTPSGLQYEDTVLGTGAMGRGIAQMAGIDVVKVPGVTDGLDNDYVAQAQGSLKALENHDLVVIHVEAPDEAGHLGSIDEKVRAIERVDGVVGTIAEEFDGVLAVLPDHPTPIRIKTHSREPVPFVVRGKGKDATTRFSEQESQKGQFGLIDATAFLPLLFS